MTSTDSGEKMITRNILFDELGISWDNLWISSGNIGYKPEGQLLQIFESVKSEIASLCRPSYSYAYSTCTMTSPVGLYLDGRILETGPIISRYFSKVEKVAVYVGTAGVSFENYQRRLSAEGDMVRAFFADVVGTAIVDRVGIILFQDIEKEQSVLGNKVGYSYSPGNCLWPVSGQHGLFSFLEQTPCGVRLTGSSLMIPVKSISGIIGIGPSLERERSRCDDCNIKDCFKRRK